MCGCDDFEGPRAYSESHQRARKQHICTECHRAIPVGAVYHRFKGLWDGSWSTFKTCGGCVTIRNAFHAVEGCAAPFGGLFEIIRECSRDEPGFQVMIGIALFNLLFLTTPKG